MPIKKRRLKVTLDMQTGPVVLDESLELHVSLHKDCLGMQSTCDIDVANMTTSMRAELLTQFSAFNVRKAQTGFTPNPVYLNMKVEAGYDNETALLFTGQVAETSLVSPPPNVTMRLHCASRMIDRTKDTTQPPASGQTTFKQYVEWAAGQMGIPIVHCETPYDNDIVPGMFAAIHEVSALVMAIQAVHQPDIVAYIDNDTLTVRSLNVPLAAEQIVRLNEFIGIPTWTSTGATFTTLFDHRLHVGGLAHLDSSINPGLAQEAAFLIYSLDYSLSSRREDFYMRANCYAPAS